MLNIKILFTFLPFILLTPIYAETIELGAENGAGLWGKEDGTGCGNEIVIAAFKAVDIDIKLRIEPYARVKNEALSGKIAGCFAMAWEDSLKDKIVFAKEPLYTVRSVYFKSLTKPLLAIHKVEELPTGTKLGTVIDYEYPPEDVAAWKANDVKLIPAPRESINLNKIADGEIPIAVAMIDELKSADYLIDTSNVKNKVTVAFVSKSQGSYVGFSLKNKNGLYAKQMFDKGYKIIKQNGTLNEIIKKWISIQKEKIK